MKEKLAKVFDILKKNKQMVTIIVFAVLALASILVGTLAMKAPAVVVCIAIVLEVAIAALMHNVEIWIHGVVLIIEIVTGILIGRIALMILCVVMYIITIVALQVLYKGKE